jgi:hypothetical protein
MDWSVVFQRQRLEAGVLPIMEMSMIPEYMPSITSALIRHETRSRLLLGIPVPFLLLLALKVQSHHF